MFNMNSTATQVYQKTHSAFAQSDQVDLSSPTEVQTNFSPPMDPSNSIGQNVNPLVVPTSRPLLSPNETRILYHVDDEETPYLVKLPVSPNSIILNDLKLALSLPRPNYKFFFKSYDKEMDCVVKEEIVDDNASLPIFQGRVVAWLVSTEGSTISDSTNSQCLTEISAADRLAPGSNGTNSANERLGLVGASRPPSFHGSSTDHGGDTTTETESMISSRRGGQYLNHRHRDRGNNYKSGHHGGGGAKYASGNRYQQSHHSHHQQQHHYMDSSVMTSDMESTSYVDSDDDDDDTEYLQNGGDEDDYEDYNSTTTEETSVSRQYARKSRVRRKYKNYRNQNMSRTSSLSSITESSMSLNAIQVTLNLDQASFLGISLVGQTSKKGDGGIYVSSIMKGGAVDIEGSIAPGDMILQVNNINFENLTNDEAVQVIREAVKTPGPIKLLVAKCWDPSPKGYFTIPRSEPVRPIDPGAWVAHTEAARAKFTNPDNFPYNPSSITNFTGASSTISSSLPEPGRQLFHQPPPQMPISSITSFSNHSNSSYPTSNSGIGDTNTILSASPLRSSFKAGHNVSIAPNPVPTVQVPATLSYESGLETIAYAMASPDSGLDVRDRMWLKIPIPNAFLGSDVVNWLFSFVQGFNERRDAKKFASKLLKAGFIQHTVNLKSSFSEKCYFVFSDQLQELNKAQICCNELTQSVGSNFEDNFSNSLKLTNENFQQPPGPVANFNSQLNHFNTVPNEYSAANQVAAQQLPEPNQPAKPGMYMMPFMRYWDETSEIHNYGLFGPQPVTAEINNAGITDTASSIHSGGNCGQDSYQSDEQISQRSGQSIVFNPQAAANNHVGMTHSNTMASSGSTGSGNTNGSNFKSHPSAQNSSSINNSNNNANLLNHHYEDLQMNPVTGNLVPVSGTNSDMNPQMFSLNNGGNHSSNIFQQVYRHIDSEEGGQQDRRGDSRNEDHYNGFNSRTDNNEAASSAFSGHEGSIIQQTNNNIVFDLKARNSTSAASNNKNNSGQNSSDMNYFNRLSNFQ